MSNLANRPPRRILIASANPLFAKGLRKLLADRWNDPASEMRLVSSMAETLSSLKEWQPDLVVVDYDDRTINRAEFLNHFVASDAPMQVMLVSLQASGEVVVYDRRTMTPAQAKDWLDQTGEPDPGLPVEKNSKWVSPNGLGTAVGKKAGFFTWRWILLTVLVIVVTGVFIRLGFWQLDRLAQRRAYNARVQAAMAASPVDLNTAVASSLTAGMEYRSVTVTGVYDPTQEVVLSNQVWDGNQVGVHLITPLKIQGSDFAVLVDRGWVPGDHSTLPDRQQYAELGDVTVTGMIRATQVRGSIFGVQEQAAVNGRKDAWSSIDVQAIQKQTGLRLLPVFIQQQPDPAWTGLPHRQAAVVDLTEGPHLGYAIQWFLFATILVVGFPLFIRRQLKQQRKDQSVSTALDGPGKVGHHHA